MCVCVGSGGSGRANGLPCVTLQLQPLPPDPVDGWMNGGGEFSSCQYREVMLSCGSESLNNNNNNNPSTSGKLSLFFPIDLAYSYLFDTVCKVSSVKQRVRIVTWV